MHLPKHPRFTFPVPCEPGNEPVQIGGIADELPLESPPAFFGDQLCEAHQKIAMLMDQCQVGGLLRVRLRSLAMEIEGMLEDYPE